MADRRRRRHRRRRLGRTLRAAADTGSGEATEEKRQRLDPGPRADQGHPTDDADTNRTTETIGWPADPGPPPDDREIIDAPRDKIITPYQVRPASKTERTIAAQGWGAYGLLPVAGVAQILARSNDDAEQEFGDQVYEFVHNDPPAGASLDLLRVATFSHDLKVIPRVQPQPGKGVEDYDQAELNLSSECADFFTDCLDRLEVPFIEVINGMFESALKFGNSLGELVWEYAERGRWKGKLMPLSIDIKPRRAWSWVVDPFWRPVGIMGMTPWGPAIFPEEKFLTLTWGMRDGDPRGRSIYRKAVKPWSIRMQLIPEHFRHCQRFGSPLAWAELPAEADKSVFVYQDQKSPEQATLAALEGLRNGAAAVIGHGGSYNFAEAQGDGVVFMAALDYYARLEVLAILLQVRATTEAKFGSKADSEGASDLLGNMTRYVKQWVERSIERGFAYKCIAYNYGAEIADKHTPILDLGSSEHQDNAKLWSAVAQLFSSGYLTPSQLAQIDSLVNLPVRSAQEQAIAVAMQEAGMRAAQAGADAAEAGAQNPDGPPAAGGPDGGAKPPAKGGEKAKGGGGDKPPAKPAPKKAAA